MPMSSTLDYLKKLIAFDTTSRNSNLELIDFIIAELDSHGVSWQLTHSQDKRKANLFATLGDDRDGGIILSGHTDVVPVDGQDWSSDPFAAVIKDDKLYGRGSCDMKGFIAVCLSRMDSILNSRQQLPVHFAFSYDEEVGCVGVHGLLDALQQRQRQPALCIVGEPTSMAVVDAHKGMLFQRCRIHGHAAHSSLIDQGINAINIAAHTIAHVDDLQQQIQRDGPFDEGFDPPYSTLHCGVIQGGTTNNIIAEHCTFDFEIRNLPNHQVNALDDDVKAFAAAQASTASARCDGAEAQVEWQTLAQFPGLQSAADDALLGQLNTLLKRQGAAQKVSYGTEGGLFQQQGITTVVCGPGSIAQAHKPDEFIPLEQLHQAEQFINNLVKRYP